MNEILKYGTPALFNVTLKRTKLPSDLKLEVGTHEGRVMSYTPSIEGPGSYVIEVITDTIPAPTIVRLETGVTAQACKNCEGSEDITDFYDNGKRKVLCVHCRFTLYGSVQNRSNIKNSTKCDY